jgi:hypothetical protein
MAQPGHPTRRTRRAASAALCRLHARLAVSARVNTPRNDDSLLIEPATTASDGFLPLNFDSPT